MKKILITGIGGFAASHLARILLQDANAEISGTLRLREDVSLLRDIIPSIKTHLLELTDAGAVWKLIHEIKPNQIYHLAAQTYVRLSWDAPVETYQTNIIGTVNLLEAARDVGASVLVTSSSEIYGNKEGVINEETVPDPISPYGISKYGQDMIARMYHKVFGMPVVVTRAFNITGPGRSDIFVDSNFAKQVVDIEKGAEPVIYHGNLAPKKDFLDIQDVIEGYVKTMESGLWGEVFCFCTGKSRSIEDLLRTLVKLSRAESITTKMDPARFRPVDVVENVGSYEKAKRLLGWEPVVPFEKSMERLLEYYRGLQGK